MNHKELQRVESFNKSDIFFSPPRHSLKKETPLKRGLLFTESVWEVGSQEGGNTREEHVEKKRRENREY